MRVGCVGVKGQSCNAPQAAPARLWLLFSPRVEALEKRRLDPDRALEQVVRRIDVGLLFIYLCSSKAELVVLTSNCGSYSQAQPGDGI